MTHSARLAGLAGELVTAVTTISPEVKQTNVNECYVTLTSSTG